MRDVALESPQKTFPTVADSKERYKFSCFFMSSVQRSVHCTRATVDLLPLVPGVLVEMGISKPLKDEEAAWMLARLIAKGIGGKRAAKGSLNDWKTEPSTETSVSDEQENPMRDTSDSDSQSQLREQAVTKIPYHSPIKSVSAAPHHQRPQSLPVQATLADDWRSVSALWRRRCRRSAGRRHTGNLRFRQHVRRHPGNRFR